MGLKFDKHHYKYNEIAYSMFLVNRIITLTVRAALSSPIIYMFLNCTFTWHVTSLLTFTLSYSKSGIKITLGFRSYYSLADWQWSFVKHVYHQAADCFYWSGFIPAAYKNMFQQDFPATRYQCLYNYTCPYLLDIYLKYKLLVYQNHFL